MNSVTGFMIGLAWPPFFAFAWRLVLPHWLPDLRYVLAYWLADALLLTIVYLLERWLPGAAGPGLSALIAAAWLWWRWKRPGKAVRSFGAKSKARIEAMTRRMPRARIPVPVPQ